MKLRDAGATVLIAISLVYFIDWAISSVEPEQCWVGQELEDGRTVYHWRDCTEEELKHVK